jgi:hypothetical protein
MFTQTLLGAKCTNHVTVATVVDGQHKKSFVFASFASSRYHIFFDEKNASLANSQWATMRVVFF